MEFNCATLWCDLGVLLTLALRKCFLLPYLRHSKIFGLLQLIIMCTFVLSDEPKI